MPEPLVAILKAHQAEQDKEKAALGTACRDEDLVFARADGSPVNPWNFGRAVLGCIKRAKVTPITLTVCGIPTLRCARKPGAH